MTTIISTLARKGGVGKTTFTVNLGAALSLRGKSVLIVESDGQGNSTQALGLDAANDFHRLILEDAEFADVIRPVPKAYTGKVVDLHVLSASDLQLQVEKHADTSRLIYTRFQELRGVFDFVLVDNSPGLTEIHNGLYYASDYALLPTLCDSFGVSSVEKMLEFIAVADAAGQPDYPAAKILGIIPNRYNTGARNSQFNYGTIYGRFGQQHRVFDRMRELSAWETANFQNRSIYNLTTGLDRRLAISGREARKEFEHVVEAALKTEGAIEHA